MEDLYKKVIDKVLESGKRIKFKAGNIEDVGVKKRWLTEEDIKIERDLKALIYEDKPDHLFCAEEENEIYEKAEDVWVVDPISGTRSFINNTGAYGVVIAHVHKGRVIFSVVYDPKNDELFTAQKNKGAFLNNSVLQLIDTPKRLLFRVSSEWKNEKIVHTIRAELEKYEYEEIDGSMAVTECQLAAGRCSGVICLTKDSFPHFSSSLIVQEAGFMYSNKDGSPVIEFEDRIFISGNEKMYKKFFDSIRKNAEK